MEFLLIAVALALLVALGVAIVCSMSGSRDRFGFSMVLGYGVFAGLIGVPLVLRLLNALGSPLSFAITGTSTAALAACLLYLAHRRGALRFPLHGGLLGRSKQHGLVEQAIVVALLLLLCVRFHLLALEVVWNPLYPWDATMHWATKSKTWLEHLELLPFVENTEWLELNSTEVYTDHHPGYPITSPLLQLWMTSALGYWNESAMNLPWVLCFVALGFAFYAQSRVAGASNLMSLTFVYFLLSMPLLNTQIALAGYADVLLGTCYCLAIMAFHNWSVGREKTQAAMAVFFAASCMLIKNEGFFWAMTFAPALFVVLMPGKRAWLVLFAAAAIAVAALFFFPKDFVVAGHSLNELKVFYREWALKPIFQGFFVHDNWHLFAYLLSGLLVLSTLVRRSVFSSLQGISVALLAALSLFLFLFTFTAYSYGARQLTAVGRISLQLVPAAMFYCLLLANALFSRASISTREEG